MTLDHAAATDDELVAFCFSPNREVVSSVSYGNIVIKLSDRAVIVGVREGEAHNLRAARQLLDRTIVRVPLAYRFFTHQC